MSSHYGNDDANGMILIIMKKRLIAITLCLFLSASLFGGCKSKQPVSSSNNSSSGASSVTSSQANSETNSTGNSETSNSGSNDSSSVASSSQTPGSTSSGSQVTPSQSSSSQSGNVNPSFEKIDLKGRVIRVYADPGWDLSKDKSNELLKKRLGYFSDAEKMFNCKFQFTYITDRIKAYNQLVTGYMSGKPSFDVIDMAGYNVTPRYAGSKVIADLSDYYNYDKDPAWQNQYVKNVAVWRGDRYGVSYGDIYPGYAIWYNKKLFAAANVPDPWTFVKAGTWNWSTFRDICKKLTRDTNGDKKTDVWAFNAEDPVSMFVMTNGAKMIDTSTDNAKYAGDSAAAIEAIEYYKLLRGIDKVVPNESSGMDPTIFNQFQTNKLAMFPYAAGYGPYLVKKGLKVEDLGWVYWPKGNAVKNKNYIIPSLTEPTCWVVANKIPDIKGVIHAITYATAFWSDQKSNKADIMDPVTMDKKSDTWMDFYDDPGFTTLMKDGPKFTAYTKVFNYEIASPVINEMSYKIISGQLTTATALKSYTSKINAAIKNTEAGKLN